MRVTSAVKSRYWNFRNRIWFQRQADDNPSNRDGSSVGSKLERMLIPVHEHEGHNERSNPV